MSLEMIAEKIVKAQITKPGIFLLVLGLITILLIPGIFNLIGNVEPSLEKVLPQDIKEIETMNNMRAQFGADMMYLLVYTEAPVLDVRDPKVLIYLDLLSEKLRTNNYIMSVHSIADLAKVNGEIPNSYEVLKEELRKNPETLTLTNDHYSFTVIQIKSDTGANAEIIKEVIDQINLDIASLESYNPGVRTQITGSNAIDKATFEVIINDFKLITLVSMIAIMFVVLLTFRSLSKGMLPMAVVMLSLIWTMGLVGYLGLTITVVTMVAAAMIMGLGIDFGIHIVHNYFTFQKTMKKQKAMIETMKELLRAMIAASLTTTAGFLALLFGELTAMKTLGIVLAIGILSTLIGAVFLLPIIVYYYDKSKKVKT